MLRVLVILPLTLIACSPDKPATTAFLDVDLSADPQQAQDRPGSQVSDLNAAAPKTRTGSSAWLEPSPATFSFTADDSAWKTFTVGTSSDLDSVLVVVNPTGKDRALEVAGGSTPPSRNYCPAEGNDNPARARRNGWSLHLSACAAGETEIVIFDYEQTELARYAVQVAEAEAQTGSSAWLEPSPATFSFTADDSAWKTFTVGTSSDVDSVLVVVNPTGKDRALEVAGGSTPPSRNYCPAEGNDSPTRARRNGWSLYLSVCQAGETEIVVYDFERVELARYTIEVAEQFEPLSDYPEHWMDDLPDHAVFNIELVFLDDFSQWQKDEMRWAADLWELAFTDELPDADIAELRLGNPFNDLNFPCGDHFIEPSGVVDDVKVYVAKYERSWFLASGEPSLQRIVPNQTTVLGCVQIRDAPYISYDQIFAHELGHVLGIGTSGFVYDTNSEYHVIASSTLYYEYPVGAAESEKLDSHTYLIAPEAQRAFKEMGDWPTKEIPLNHASGGHWAQYPLGNSVMSVGDRTIYEPRITEVDLAVLSHLGYSVGNSPTKPIYFIRAVPFANGEYELEGWNLEEPHPRRERFNGKPVAGPNAWCGVGRDLR